MMNNQRGLITLDFVFALVIGFGMSAILFAMTFTLSMVEVAQYIAFSTARAYAGANITPEDQEKAARDKYAILLQNVVIGPLFSNGWFELSNKSALEVKGGPNYGGTFTSDYKSGGTGPARGNMTGVRTKFTAKMLSLRLPLIGSTSQNDEGFSTRINAILIRESTQKECQAFMQDRFAKINELTTQGQGPRYRNYSNPKNYVAMEDNGC